MIVSNITCMKIEYIRLKHAKLMVWSFNPDKLMHSIYLDFSPGNLLCYNSVD
ncbi:hypothetical protein LDENG_00034490 [Lucifuga dentata]|nr:hypothetical protein LDENG_00034490 [Lucifuga dentata]